MASFETVSFGGYGLDVLGGGRFGGCIGTAMAETAVVFPPVPLAIALDQSEPAATSTGSFVISGTITSSETIVSATLTVDTVAQGIVLGVGGAFSVLLEGLSQGFNTVVIDATDPDEVAQETLVVAYQPPAQLRDVLVLDPVSVVIERLPWHLRATR